MVYGAADFLGGLASRRQAAFPVTAMVQIVGLVPLIVAAPLLSADAPTTGDLAWGGAGGAAGGLGIALLYRALAGGRMSVVAPVTAVCAIVVPVVVGLALGERLSATVLAGVVLAMAAIVLISQERASHDVVTPSARLDASLALALGSGIAIGAFYVFLKHTRTEAGLWPLLAARFVSLSGFALVAVAGRRSMWIAPEIRGIVLAAGLLDVLANALYLLAVRKGMLSVVATLSSLYPASTVLLAYVILRERLRWIQIGGLAAAAVAVFMIAG